MSRNIIFVLMYHCHSLLDLKDYCTNLAERPEFDQYNWDYYRL
jgi:hypothetical protein